MNPPQDRHTVALGRFPEGDTMNETRVLVAARLSRLVKGRDQVSIERQDRQAEDYAAAAPGRVIVATAADPGVSGAVSPFKRPELGKYLDPRGKLIGTWDELVAAALDRLGRNARDLAALRDFAEDHGKRLVILSPRLTWPPAEDDFASGLIWDVLGRLAEIELRLTAKRYADTRAYLRDRESLIGKPCWGFIVTGTKAEKTLTPDPARLDYLLGMIDRALAGTSLEAIAEWLDGEAEHSPAARPRMVARWSPKSVSQILRNPSLAGRRKDEHGRTELRHEGVITAEKFARLQAVLDGNPKRRGPTRNAPALLTDVLICDVCGGVMHARRTPGRKRLDGTRQVWVGYRCDHTKLGEDEKTGRPILARTSTCRNLIRADEIEPWVNETFVEMFGDLDVVERTFVPPRGYAAEIAEVEADLRALDFDADDYAERHAALLAERARLRDLGTEPGHYEDRETGEFVSARWGRLTPAQRRDYLIRSGTKVRAASRATAAWVIDVAEPNVLRVT